MFPSAPAKMCWREASMTTKRDTWWLVLGVGQSKGFEKILSRTNKCPWSWGVECGGNDWGYDQRRWLVLQQTMTSSVISSQSGEVFNRGNNIVIQFMITARNRYISQAWTNKTDVLFEIIYLVINLFSSNFLFFVSDMRTLGGLSGLCRYN